MTPTRFYPPKRSTAVMVQQLERFSNSQTSVYDILMKSKNPKESSRGRRQNLSTPSTGDS
jgi:hypothetical protein